MAEQADYYSGCSHKQYKIRLRFRKYLKDDFNPVIGESASELKGDVGKVFWIYIYKLFSWGASLHGEISVNDKGEYSEVLWGEQHKDKVQGKDIRNPSTKAKKEFFLTYNENAEYYFFLSHFQLPFKRIEEYRKNPDKIKNRAQLFNPSDSCEGTQKKSNFHIIEFETEKNEKGYYFYIIDYIIIAKNIQKEFLNFAKDYNQYLSNKIKAKKRYLADIIWGLCQKNLRIKNSLRYKDLITFRENEDYKLKEMKLKSDGYCEKKCNWMLTLGYKTTRDDYSGTEEIENEIQKCEAYLLEGNLSSKIGLNYLETIASDESSWYYRYFFADEPFQVWRKSITLGAENGFAELFSNFIMGRIAYHSKMAKIKIRSKVKVEIDIQTLIVEEINQILVKRPQIVIPDLVLDSKTNKYFWVAKEDNFLPTKTIRYNIQTKITISSQVSVDFSEYYKHRKTIEMLEQRRKVFEGINEKVGLILIPIEAINLFSALEKMQDTDDPTVDVINLTGAIADSLSSIEVLVKRKLAKETSPKVFAPVNIVGSLCDYLVGITETYRNVDRSKWGLATGHATTALAATSLGAGAGLELAAVFGSGTATAFGLSATMLGIIGVGLFLAGVVFIYIFTEDPLEEWVKVSLWGEDFPIKTVDVDGVSIDVLNKQIAELHKILSKFEIKCFKYVKYELGIPYNTEFPIGFRLILKPGFCDPLKSKYIIRDLEIRAYEGAVTDYVLPSKTYIKLDKLEFFCKDYRNLETGNLYLIDKIWTKEELELPRHFDYKSYSYYFKCSAQLDFLGDGSLMYPDKAELYKGELEKDYEQK